MLSSNMNMTPPVNHKTKHPKTILWLYYLPNTFWDVLDNFNDLYVILWSVLGHLYCPLKSLFIHLGTTMSVENLGTLLVFSACNLWRDNIAWDDAEAIKGTSDSLLAAYLRTKGLGGKGEPAANNGRLQWLARGCPDAVGMLMVELVVVLGWEDIWCDE